MSIEKDIKGAGCSVILLATFSLLVIAFGLNVLLWHLAREMSWLAYALSVTGGTFVYSLVKSMITTYRKDRRERRNRTHGKETTVLPSARPGVMGTRANGGSKPGHPSPWS